MKISDLEYLISDLKAMKALGGKYYKEASECLNIEATTDNINKCMKVIQNAHNKKNK